MQACPATPTAASHLTYMTWTTRRQPNCSVRARCRSQMRKEVWSRLTKATGPEQASHTFCPSDLDDEEAAERFGAYTPRGIDGEEFCKCGGPRRAPATPLRQYWDAEGMGEFSEASTSSSNNSRWYERAARGLSSAGAPRRPIFMGEEPLISRLERLKLGCWYFMETSDSD